MLLTFSCKVKFTVLGDICPVKTTNEKPNYTVFVDDNFHFMNEDERWTAGTYKSLDDALQKCMEMVGQFMLEQDYPAMKADTLYRGYTSFGDDPFIIGPVRVKFSAWDYAKALANVLAGTPAEDGPRIEQRFRLGYLTALLHEARIKEAGE